MGAFQAKTTIHFIAMLCRLPASAGRCRMRVGENWLEVMLTDSSDFLRVLAR